MTLLTCHAAAGSSLSTAAQSASVASGGGREGGSEQSYKVSTTDAVAAVAAMAFAEPCNLLRPSPKYRVEATAERSLWVCHRGMIKELNLATELHTSLAIFVVS